MGRIVVPVTIINGNDPTKQIHCEALVDTGAPLMVLPTAWREQLGVLPDSEELELETASQSRIIGEVCGPVRLQIEGFRTIGSEVIFLERESGDGYYEPLLGHIPLQAAQAAVDFQNHRLTHVKYLDLK